MSGVKKFEKKLLKALLGHPLISLPVADKRLGVGDVHLVQMISWEVDVAGSSFSRLLDRSRVCRWRRPQGNTEGKAAKEFEDRSRWTIREDRSMNQSSSNQGSCRLLQQTLTVYGDTHIREQLLVFHSYHRHVNVRVAR